MNSIQLQRYSRQCLLPQIASSGQQALDSTKVAVIGAGGLGSTALMFLASSGIGELEVLDFDDVELSNLHRQIIHPESSIGSKKSLSAETRLRDLNSNITVRSKNVKIDFDNALDLFKKFDVLVDATDNLESRYIINDACVILGKPLVSGSSVGLDGQITVLCFKNGPCYRCLHPDPSGFTQHCSDTGVLGPVPGLIGCLQAIEAIKVALCIKQENYRSMTPLINRQTFYDGARGDFYTFQLPGRNQLCEVCGDQPSIRNMDDSRANITNAQAAYRATLPTVMLPEDAYVSTIEYAALCSSDIPHILLDVRSKVQYEMVSMDSHYSKSSSEPHPWDPERFSSINIPLSDLRQLVQLEGFPASLRSQSRLPIYVICRRGVDSASAASLMLAASAASKDAELPKVFNIRGGIASWTLHVDPHFPRY